MPEVGAAAFAMVLVVIASAALAVKRRLATVVVVCLLFGVPVVGLSAYALKPSNRPTGAPFALAGLIATIAAVIALVIASRSPRVPLRRRSYLYLLGLGASVIAMASVLAIWEPYYAVVEVALGVVWAAAWLPAGQRTTDVQMSKEISAPRSTVFAFVANPLNWPTYQEWTDSVTAEPAEPVAEGSRVTVVRSGPDFHGQPSPDATTVTYLVDEVVPDSLIGMVMLGQLANRITWQMSDSPMGTTFATRAWGVVPYPYAIFGMMLEFWQHWNLRIARAERTLATLKQVLEQPQSQLSTSSEA